MTVAPETAAAPADVAQRFLLENLDIRGQVVRLGPLWETLVGRRSYLPSLRGLLGEFSTLAVCIAAGLKHPGRVVIQVMGHGPVSLAVADCTHDLALRALVKTGGDFAGDGPTTVPVLFGDGRLALTVENHATGRTFQSIVPLEGDTLAECFERYFDRSEQVPTHVWVQVGDGHAGALVLQKLPKADAKDPGGWARVQQQAARQAPRDLGAAIAADGVAALLRTLFPEDDIRLFKPWPVKDGCTRSEEKVIAMLRGLGRGEVERGMAATGRLEVHDDMCNQGYTFTRQDLPRLFGR